MADFERHPTGTAAALDRVATALPVLQDILRTLGLQTGTRIAGEMIEELAELRARRDF